MHTNSATHPACERPSLRTTIACDPLVLDQVFAELPEVDMRVDGPQRPAAKASYAAETQQLVANIGEQLRAIDAQRSRLVRLLSEMQEPTGR